MGSFATFAHETKIIATSAITANNYNYTITFIVRAEVEQHLGSKITRGAHNILQRNVYCNFSRN